MYFMTFYLAFLPVFRVIEYRALVVRYVDSFETHLR